MIRVLSPLSLMTLCWGLTGFATALTLAWLDQLDLVQTFLAREGLDLRAFSAIGLLWLLIGLICYATGDMAARLCLPPVETFRPALNRVRAAQLTFAANLILLGVTLFWVATTAAQKGGFSALVQAAYYDSLSTREILLENKLFTGMRLFYAALPATGALAAAILCTGPLPRQSRRLCQITLALNVTALFFLPMVMSQRLLLLQLLLAAYLAACMAKGRVFGLPWLALAVALFLGLWIGREAITNPLMQQSATEIGLQKLAFYVVNDMWNSFAPIGQAIPHTWGKLSLEGMMFLTFTDGIFLPLLEPKMDQLDLVLGGGEFPFFASAYVDFGPLGGVVLIAAFAFVFRWVFHKARHSIGWAAIYAQIGAALLFSSHSVYVTHQNFLFSIMLIALIARLSRRMPHKATYPDTQTAERPALFRSRRTRSMQFSSRRGEFLNREAPHEPT